MTKDKFVDNPFEKGKLMYATGDLAYKNFDGNYTYCGRRDTQTKLRGFRIELEEVEKVVLRESNASEVCVVIHKNMNSEYLCAYIAGVVTDVDVIKKKMRKFLPDYMIPTYIVFIEKMPLTTNGKVDKKRLPLPDINSSRNYIAPRNDREKKIIEIFSEVLGVKVGLGDFFFELGGDSIKAMRIVSKLKEKGYKIPIRTIMSRMDMQQVVSSVEDTVKENKEYQILEGDVENSIIQEMFWKSNLKRPEHFNQSVMLEVDSKVSAATISCCLQKIVETHDMLRAKFPYSYPVIRNKDEDHLYELQEFYYFSVNDVKRRKELIIQATDALNKSMDLLNGPLLKAIFFCFNDKNYLYITIHHLVVDSVSWSIILDDLNGYCENILLSQNKYKPLHCASYVEWNKKIESLSSIGDVQREMDYWNKVDQFMLNNIIQYKYTASDKMKCTSLVFGEKMTNALVNKAGKAYNMEVKDIIITALLRAMTQAYGNEKQVISMESHGRQNDYIELDIDRTVGWFTSFYPILFENLGIDIQSDLVNVKEKMSCVPKHGSDYLSLKSNNVLKISEYLHPLVNFNFQGTFVYDSRVSYFARSNEEYAIPMAAENIFGSPISLDGIVINNKFEVVFSYVQSLEKELEICALIENFRKELKGIVDFCTNQKHRIVTPMDLGCPGMNWNDFQTVQEFANSESLNIQSIYPLTPLQEGILFESINNENDGYVIQAIFEFSDTLRISCLRGAIEKLFSMHEVLRTRILYDGLERPYQIIVKENNIDFQYYNCRNIKEKEYLEIIDQDKKNGILFGTDPLIRFKLFQLEERKHLLLMTYHHIIIDGWSTGVMLKDLTNIYNNKEAYTDRTVGWFTTEYPVVFENIGNDPFRDLVNVKETLHLIPNKGLGYIILQNAYPNMFIDIDPDITFNYLGEFGQEGNYGFSISEIKKARDKDVVNAFRTPITINSMIINKKYHLEVTYENNIFNREYVKQIIDCFLSELENIIEMCKNTNDKLNTPSDYGEVAWSFEELQSVIQKNAAKGKNILAINTLTPMQESMLYHKRLYPSSSEYTVQVDLVVDKEIQIATLYRALNCVGENHGALRANIIFDGVSEPREVIFEKVEFKAQIYDYSKDKKSNQKIEDIKKQEIDKGFDLENDTLLRMIVCKNANNVHAIITFHHIILDGWSCMLLISELFKIYEKLSNDIPVKPKYENIQGIYGKYIRQKDKKAAYAYWGELLYDYTEPCTIKALTHPNVIDKDIPGKVQTHLDNDIKDMLEKFAHNHALSINTIIETVWGLILSSYTRKNDVVFGKVVSGRNVDISEINESLGMYINTIPVRVIINSEETLINLLENVHVQSAKANDYDFCSLEEIQQMTQIKSKLLGSAISFENYQESQDNKMYRIAQVRELSSFPISVSAQSGQQLILSFLYDTSIYEENEMKMLLERFVDILKQMITAPYRKVKELRYITQKEERMINKFNDNKALYPLESNMVDLFKEQVKRTPDNIALIFHDNTMTYKELNAKAEILAHKIALSGRGENKIVPIIVKPSMEMVIGILGVLAAGAAYLPIDPETPQERIKYMLEQVNAKTILTTSFYDILRDKRNLYIDRIDGNFEDDYEISIEPSDNAYVIFTSGTTGAPKGVVVSHKNLINHTYWQIESSNYNESVTMVQTISFTFDGHASEIYPVLLSGGTLVIADEMQRKDPKELLKLVEGNRMTFIPSLLREVIGYAEETGQTDVLHKFDKMYIAAEPITKKEILKMLCNNHTKMQDIYHFYGPTEATITTVAINLLEAEDDGVVPIGHPIANTEVYILDSNQNILGIGLPGEICLAGASVSKGYLNNRNMTKEKFINWNGKILYCTGDIGCWDEKGLLHFIGRKDDQIKLRGFRIELQEITSTLRKCNGIKAATVAIKEVKGDKAICAYMVLSNECSVDEIKDQLAIFLPEYMLPQYYIEMKALPITSNGKLDKKALPSPKSNIEKKSITLPRTDTEREMVKLFIKVLNVENVDIDDSFYSLGGHSLKMTRLLNEIEKKFGKRLSLRNVMEAKTVRRISYLIDNEDEQKVKKMSGLSVAKPIN